MIIAARDPLPSRSRSKQDELWLRELDVLETCGRRSGRVARQWNGRAKTRMRDQVDLLIFRSKLFVLRPHIFLAHRVRLLKLGELNFARSVISEYEAKISRGCTLSTKRAAVS